ncbi:hypothetical protein C4D60_Mb08t20450 [Musa balbisiana]|uniref:Uncharacterized protein n=1 Tax=Musa balbisiana TaxID=52838 RepID=A0A4S8K5C2_MUSBA|nr:hypothetical protein C4D60_Mb08t20450 [Musa balbisiana]
MTILRLAFTAYSAFPSCDHKPLSSYDTSAPLMTLASGGGRKTALGFSFQTKPMPLSSSSPSTRSARFMVSSQEHDDESSSEGSVPNFDLYFVCRKL